MATRSSLRDQILRKAEALVLDGAKQFLMKPATWEENQLVGRMRAYRDAWMAEKARG